MDLRELYQDIILDHARSPRNFGVMSQPSHLAHGHNPLCGDKLTVFMKIDDDHITKVSFEGRGCAISTASASLMTEILLRKYAPGRAGLCGSSHQHFLSSWCPARAGGLTGKSVAQAEAVFAAFHARVTTGAVVEVASDLEDATERLEPLTGVRTYPARVAYR